MVGTMSGASLGADKAKPRGPTSPRGPLPPSGCVPLIPGADAAENPQPQDCPGEVSSSGNLMCKGVDAVKATAAGVREETKATGVC